MTWHVLGPSPNHSRSVSLVLNPRTGHVSPQFHVKHDVFFETIDRRHHNYGAPTSTWNELSRLTATQYKKAVQCMIKPLREPVSSPASAIDKSNQEDPHMISSEPCEDEHLIEEPLAATAHQEEPATTSERQPEQHQTRSGQVVPNTECYSEGLDQ